MADVLTGQVKDPLKIQMPTLPITSTLTKSATASVPSEYITAQEIAPAMEEQRSARGQIQQEMGGIDTQIARAEQERAYKKAEEGARLRKEELTRGQEAPERERLRMAREELSNAAFIPTKQTTTDLATLFSLMSIVGMAIGGEGRANAYAGMAAMNGMLEGYQKGRADLYKKEQEKFDKNLKTMQLKVQTLETELKEALDTYKNDRLLGEQMAEVAFAKANAPIVEQTAKKRGLESAYQFVVDTGKDMDKLVSLRNDLVKRSEDLQFKREEAKRQDQLRRDLASQQNQLRRDIAAMRQPQGQGRPLPATQVDKIEGLSSIANSLEKLEKDFKPEFASLGVLGFGADASFELKRRLGDKKAQEAISWWSRYSRLQAPNRHALFGATLTGNELKDYQQYTAKKSDSAETIKTMLRDQINYSQDLANEKVVKFESTGYRVPEIRPRNFEQTYGGGQSSAAGQADNIATQADIAETARANNMSIEQAKSALRNRGYQIEGE